MSSASCPWSIWATTAANSSVDKGRTICAAGFVRRVQYGSILITVADRFLAARCSGVPFFDRRCLLWTPGVGGLAGGALAARSSGVPFFERRGRRAAKRFLYDRLGNFTIIACPFVVEGVAVLGGSLMPARGSRQNCCQLNAGARRRS